MKLRWLRGKRGLYSAVQAHRALWSVLSNINIPKAHVARRLGMCLVHDCVFCQYAVEKSGVRASGKFCVECPGLWGDGERGSEGYHCSNAKDSWYWKWENLDDIDEVKEAAFMVMCTPLKKWNYGKWSW